MSSLRAIRVGVGEPTWEDVNGKQELVGTYKVKMIDGSKFIKTYPRFVDLLESSSKPALKIIIYVLRLVQDAKFGHEVYCFNYVDVKMGKVNFYRGIAELLEYQFLYKTHIPSQYKINTRMVLNGKRKKDED